MLSREQRIFVGGGKGGSIRIHSAYALFRYSIPMLPEAAQFGGTPACQWFSGLELFLPRIRRAELGRLSPSRLRKNAMQLPQRLKPS